MNTATFAFSDSHQLRVSVLNQEPWFAFKDIATSLEYSSQSISATHKLIATVPKQWKRLIEFDTAGGSQKLWALNEQGMYFFVCRSDKPKALPFQMWLAGEVLPSIRKTGSYTMPSDTIDVTQQYLVRLAVSRQAKGRGSHYQRIYHSIYDQFKVPRYQELKKADFLKVMQFLNATDLIEETHDKKGVFLPDNIAQQIVNFIYQYRYQFKPLFEAFYRTLCVVQSPVAPTFWESYHDLNLALLEGYMSKNGYSVRSLPSYQKYIANN